MIEEVGKNKASRQRQLPKGSATDDEASRKEKPFIFADLGALGLKSTHYAADSLGRAGICTRRFLSWKALYAIKK
ncbi:MAG: hypothetical protein LBE61_04055 [Burkholderiaceae bacterium]|nr:hypothetical protein [Burkholderiaceae bacterium]